MNRPTLKPETIYFGTVLCLMVTALTLRLTGTAPRAAMWLFIVAIGLGLLPTLIVLMITIPGKWRDGWR